MPIQKPHPDAVELRGLRSAHSKSFALPDGSVRVEVRPAPVCYVSDQGEIRSIDTTVQQADGMVFIEWAPYKFQLHKTGVGFDFQARDSGFARVSLLGIGGEAFDGEADYQPSINGDTITFADVKPGCDIVFRILPNRVKTLRIVKTSTAPREFEWLCDHNETGRKHVGTQLRGTDAQQRPLDLSCVLVDVAERTYRLVEKWSGLVKTRDQKTRIKSLSRDVSYPVEIDPTVNYDVSNNYDDGLEIVDPVGYHTTGDYSATHIGSDAYLRQNAVWRFRTIAVPQGATITSAILSLNVTGNQTAYGGGTIWGYAKDNMANDWYYGYNKNSASVAAKTASSTTIARPSSAGIKTYDVTAIIQNIVSRAGWASGNNAGLFALTYESSASPRKTLFEDYQDSGSSPASLSITYTAGGGGGAVSSNLLLLGCGA